MIKIIGVGLMSGTSLDGLDIAIVEFDLKEITLFKILQAKTISYDLILKSQLENSFHYSAYEFEVLHNNYGKWIGEKVNEFINEFNYKIDFIASHGHTIFHEPNKGITTQIGSGAHIYAQTGITTICDFRTVDVASGGQGAPLVPKGDRELFGEFDFLLNIGGIANITYNPESIAFDISIANMALNHFAEKLGKNYDEEGKIAKSGKLDSELLNQLNSLDFYKLAPPKSLGREYFESTFLPIINTSRSSIENKLHTICVHIAIQINNSIELYSKPNVQKKMLVSGGGVLNTFLIEKIKEQCIGTQIVIPNTKIIEFKEALIFAYLGLLRLQNKKNCLKSVTGAKHDVIGGAIYGTSLNIYKDV